jgi:hypothetical protein
VHLFSISLPHFGPNGKQPSGMRARSAALDEQKSDKVMSSRRVSVLTLCGRVALAGVAAVAVLGFGMPIENSEVPVEANHAASAVAAAEIIDAAPVIAARDVVTGDAALPDPGPAPQPEPRSMQLASIGTPDPVPDDAREVARPAQIPAQVADDCAAVQTCIDQYLWSVYERTPKQDTNKLTEKVKVTVKKGAKTRTVTKTVVKLVEADFTWKDPKAAEKSGMPLPDYVIGGMEPSFRLKLYHALRAMDDAGLVPGITSAFRDDYRQAIASGKKAASDSSYHGGSRRGGYGHGLAADLVSAKGETRTERWRSTEELWKWIDDHGKEYGIGRPYLDRDPPHVGPIDGKEYVEKRALAELQKARRSAARHDHNRAKRAKATTSSKVKSI